jgi:hypothetical protein
VSQLRIFAYRFLNESNYLKIRPVVFQCGSLSSGYSDFSGGLCLVGSVDQALLKSEVVRRLTRDRSYSLGHVLKAVTKRQAAKMEKSTEQNGIDTTFCRPGD